jgi:5-methyltetrahydropteroyltriglutamate--homocysteine methyltransferase
MRGGFTSSSQANRIQSVLSIIREHARPDQLIYVGVTDPIDPTVETAEQVRDRVVEAAEYIPVDRLGSTDDCGFAPFGDDTSTARETAFQKIQARVTGTQMAAQQLGVG